LNFKPVILIIIIFKIQCCFAQTPNWQWAKSAGSTNSEGSSCVATDNAGNSFVTGYFYSPSIVFGTYTLTNNGFYDVFLVKYDASGNVLWAKSFGGIYDDVGYSVATDVNGNVILVGSFFSPTLSIGSNTLINNGAEDIFIVKYDNLGNEIWVKQEGGSFQESCKSVTTDLNGNIFFTGYFKSPTIFTGTYTLTNSGSEDFFIIKYDNLGNTVWANSSVGAGKENGKSIKADALGNVYVTGFFNNTMFFNTFSLTPSGFSDVFVVKYDNLGNELWAKSSGGNSTDIGYGISIDTQGNVFVTGSFCSLTFSCGTFSLVNSSLDYDIFILKYDQFGNEVWATNIGGLYEDEGFGIVNDALGNVYVTGHFHSPAIIFGSNILSNSGTGDSFVVKYTNAGNVVWAQSAGGLSDDGSTSIAVNNAGELFIAGTFFSPLINFSSIGLTNAGGGDMFLGKIESLTTNKNKSEFDVNDLVLFPNPSTGKFKIAGSTSVKSVLIYNQLGQLVYLLETNQNSITEFDICFLEKGVYLSILKSEDAIKSFKLIIQ
jgi:hypothetical protein